jgi:hypothetical protein
MSCHPHSKQNKTKKMRTKTTQRLIVGVIALCVTLTSASIASTKETADADITSAINTEMRVDHAVSANDVDVTTKDGVVTLEGTVNNILAKDRAFWNMLCIAL